MPRLENGPASAFRAHSNVVTPLDPKIAAGNPIPIFMPYLRSPEAPL